MTQPYPGTYPVVPAPPKYRALRRTAIVSIVLMGLTALAAVGQAVLMWTSYEEVKRLVYGLLSEDELERGAEAIARTGPLLDVVGYLLPATGIAFIIWLWQARDNTEILRPTSRTDPYGAGQVRAGQVDPYGRPVYDARAGGHRHSQGWVVGGWFCPVVQFWYPVQIVEDVACASEPPVQPGLVRSGGLRGLLYGWWLSWTTFWVIVAGGGSIAVISFVVWVIRLVDRAEAADATGDYVDIYDLQDFMIRVALAANIGFTVATALLIVAGVTISLLILRVTNWQDTQALDRGLIAPPTNPTRPPATHHLPPSQPTPSSPPYHPATMPPPPPGQPGPLGQAPLSQPPAGVVPQPMPGQPSFGRSSFGNRRGIGANRRPPAPRPADPTQGSPPPSAQE